MILRVFALRLEEGCNVPVAPRARGWGEVFYGLKQVMPFLLASQTGCLFGAENLKRVS